MHWMNAANVNESLIGQRLPIPSTSNKLEQSIAAVSNFAVSTSELGQCRVVRLCWAIARSWYQLEVTIEYLQPIYSACLQSRSITSSHPVISAGQLKFNSTLNIDTSRVGQTSIAWQVSTWDCPHGFRAVGVHTIPMERSVLISSWWQSWWKTAFKGHLAFGDWQPAWLAVDSKLLFGTESRLTDNEFRALYY